VEGLDGDNMVAPSVTSRNNTEAVFSVRGRCRGYIKDTANRLLDLEFEDLKS
jgi:hypothetical protein